ncbi:transmembrane protein 272-like [Hyperolius riggenbachi]|uniref:transmembrane protein 272-like n=1 Tax=Hyperolius riggenbachi TaxID=752182 RepID=UPI0035A2C787
MGGEVIQQSGEGDGCCGCGCFQSLLSCGSCCQFTIKRLLETLFFFFWTAIGVAFIVVGAIHLHDCPVERYIPIYMIVAGAFYFSYWVYLPLECFFPMVRRILMLLTGLFMFAWFIAGSVWVFRVYDISERACHKGMYLFVFSILIIQWIFIAIGLIGMLISCLCCENSCLNSIVQYFACSSCCESCLQSPCSCMNCCKSVQCGSCLDSCCCLESCNCLQCCSCLDDCKCLSCLKCFSCCQCCGGQSGVQNGMQLQA